MARQPTITPPQSANLTVPQMSAGIDRLKKRIEQIELLDPHVVPERGHHSVSVIETAIEETLARVFGKGTQEYSRYLSAARLDHGPIIMGEYHDAPFRRYLVDGRAAAIAKLNQAIAGLEEEIEHQSKLRPNLEASVANPIQKPIFKRSVFIVHGRDAHPREAVARFLERIGFQVVVLHEQPNGGQTVIEKFEKHGDVGFAVVLLTPDDIGGLKGEEPQRPRARQNVILELGYFIGKLGRSRVVALKSGNIELPSDFVGVAYEDFDAGGGWQQRLAGELQNASYEIDWNVVMKPSAG